MLKSFTTKELIFITLIGVLMFIISVLLGLFLTVISGIPMLGGIIVNWLLAFSLVIVALTIRKFGVLTFTILIYSVLSVPTTNFGAPGIYKVVVGLCLGLIGDVILHYGKYKKLFYYLAAGIGYLVVPPIMYLAMKALEMPAAEKILPLLLIMTIITFIEGLLGAWIAIKVYDKKLKNNKLVKQIQN